MMKAGAYAKEQQKPQCKGHMLYVRVVTEMRDAIVVEQGCHTALMGCVKDPDR